MDLRVRIEGDKRLLRKLDRISSGLTGLKPTMTKVGKSLTSFYSSAPYASRGTVLGARWQRLDPQYRIRKFKKWGAKPILVASGTMQDSYDYEADRRQVEIFNTAKQFKFHQMGTRHMPARISMKLNQQVNNQVTDIFKQDIARLLRE